MGVVPGTKARQPVVCGLEVVVAGRSRVVHGLGSRTELLFDMV